MNVSISDNGIGIPDDVKELIFNPFFSSKPIGKGTGLGMSISYQIIVEQHNGMIDCISTVNEGTEFLISIPIKQPPMIE